MSILRLLTKEILHRKLNFLLSLLAVVVAVGLFVAVLTMGKASERETRRLMRDMGFNLIIVPKDTNMEDFWARDFSEKDMPEEYVRRLANATYISADHYVAMLQRKVPWRGRSIILTGLLPEVPAAGRRSKAPMGVTVKRGTCKVGYELAANLGLKRGDKIEIMGKTFEVAQCLGEAGSKDDIRIYVHLHDAQEMLGMKGRINVIQAIGCRCEGDRLATIRAQVARALPDTKVSEFSSIALARAETRRMMERNVALLAPGVLAVCAVWVGVLAWLNVNDRRQEIGILRAHGITSGRIAALFLGKAVLLGVVGALVGFAAGSGLALWLGPNVFKITGAKIQPIYALLRWSLVAAPAVAALASLLPAMAAVTQDPAITLTEE